MTKRDDAHTLDPVESGKSYFGVCVWLIWFLVAQIFQPHFSRSNRLDGRNNRPSDGNQLLRYQPGIAERQLQKPVRAHHRVERLTLAVLAGNLKAQTGRPANPFSDRICLFQPATVFR